ncbi:hypothetical protein ACTQ56_00975 [[Clostridium] aminophilum]|uniref:hypothetical protein n=1 Tax=[Clostridium] aminophilum TaxID=1526 RepID=UPI003F9B1172
MKKMNLVRKNWMTNNRNRKWRSQKSDGYYDCAISFEKPWHLPEDFGKNHDIYRRLFGKNRIIYRGI